MMPASKHGDPQLGVDVHLYAVPTSPLPVPLPTLHISVVFDPFDLIPVIGATVRVCGMRRTNAGTSGITVHIPSGFPFAPKLPDFDDILLMGSSTVTADGEPFTYTGLPALGCQMAGIPSIPRLKPKPLKISLLPTTVNLAIPSSVTVGGAPTISLMVLGMLAAFKALGKIAKRAAKTGAFQKFMGKFKAFRQKLFKNMDGCFLKCNILRAEPVNILTGEVSVRQEDFTLPGRIPVQWARSYASGSRHEGLCGRGWETPADARLDIDPADGMACMHHPTEGPLVFARLPAAPGEAAGEAEMVEGALLTDHGSEYRIQTKSGLSYRFPKALARVTRQGVLTCPLGRIADPCGNWLDFERRDGVLAAINESAGRRIGFTVTDGRIREISLTVPGASTRHTLARYEYDAAGDLAAAADALGQPRSYGYDQRHLVRHTDRNGLSFHYEYDKSGEDWRVTRAWGDGGLYSYTFEYIDALNERRITDSLGNVSVVTLDDRGLPICEIDPLNGKTTYEYDEVGRTTAVVDPGGSRTEYTYDDAGNLLSTVLPDGSAVSAAFSQAHKPVSMTDPEGGTWTQEWDERGNLTRQTTPSGAATQYQYNRQGDLLQVIDPAGQRTTLAYDPLGFLAGLTDAMGQTAHFQHDAQGNLLARQLANGDTTHYRYDPKNRLVESALPDGKRIRCDYDPEDNLTRYLDEARRETHFTYYCQGSLQSRTDPDGSKVEYHYDTEEQLIGVTNQKGQRWQLKRDALGRLIEEIDYWGQPRQYEYGPGGHLTKTTDPLGQALAITCDKLGRIVRKQASEAEAETYRYNKRGQLTQAKNPSCKIERKYNQDGQLTQESQQQEGIAASIDYRYNPAGQLTGQTQTVQPGKGGRGNRGNRGQPAKGGLSPIAHTQRYTYNALGQPESVQVGEHEPIRFTFDQVGRLTHQQQNQHLAQHYQYNKAGQLTHQASSLKGQRQTQTDYEYDAAGNLTRRDDSRIGTDQYRYDLLGQITHHTDPTCKARQFIHDKTGDRFKTCQETKEGRTLEQPGGSYWLLDKAGQLVRKRDAQGQETALEWDAFGRLRGLTNGGEGGGRWEYRYDALGRRVCKAKTTGPNNPADITWFVWDGDAVAGEVKQAPEATGEGTDAGWAGPAKPNGSPPQTLHAQFYSYHLGSFVPLAMQVQKAEGEGGGKSLYFYQNDPNGMPLRLTDENGIIAWEAHYTAFGLVDWVGAQLVTQPLRLQGQYFDAESQLHYNRHRYYDAGVGCFISSDPIGLAGGENPYRFAPNVFGWIDPWGLAHSPDGRVKKGSGDAENIKPKPWTKKARIKAAGLPSKGKIRYVPPKGYHPSTPLPKGTRDGYIDKFGNEWTTGPSRTEGQSFEWDVQLSNTGKSQLGWASRGGSHLNVSLDGRITHK